MAAIPASGTPYTLSHGDYTAAVASVGATLRALTHRGRDLIVPFGVDEVRPSHRGATLAPWPNRVVDGRYSFGGADFQLPLTEPARSHALHGLAVWLDYSLVDADAEHVTLACTISPQLAYPWRIAVETTFRLDAKGLTQTVTATNLSATPAPWGTAPHPYLVAGDGHVDDWTLELPAARVLTTTPDRLIPVGLEPVEAHEPERFDFRRPRPIASARIDHAFTELSRDTDGAAAVRVTTASGEGVQMSWGRECGWVQVHTADRPGLPVDRIGLAVEPMTCAPDAFNAAAYPYDTGLVVLEPGATTTAGWTISAI